MSDTAKRPPATGGSRAGMKKELSEHFKAYKHVWVFIEYEHATSIRFRWSCLAKAASSPRSSAASWSGC